MTWPSRTPDLNPINNLWGIVARDAYKDCRQSKYEDDLIEAIQASWDHIELETLQELIGSMPDRCMKVIEKHGGSTGY